MELRRLGELNWQLVTINFTAPIASPTGVAASSNGKGTEYTYQYSVTAIHSNGISESAMTVSNAVSNNIYADGAMNTITWNAVSGASRYRVYLKSAGMFGFIGETTDLSFIDDNINPDMGKVPPVYDTSLSGTGNYPASVTYYEQRRCFAGTVNKPTNIWMTRPGTESDMSYSVPTFEDDRISFRAAARDGSMIRHLVPLQQLLLLTSSAEWRVTSVNSDALTPETINVKPQSYIGSNNVQPVIVNSTIVYGAERGGYVRELGYNWQASGFVTGDISIMTKHLFDGFEITDMALSKAPNQVVWFVSTSGNLLGLTYVPEHQIGAWHHHATDGVFESVTAVGEGDEDHVYIVVKREINGEMKRYIERMDNTLILDLQDAFFVDSGLSYDGVPATQISGLDHLEGKTVSILADGAVMPQQVVTDGAVTLEQPASKVHIGLPITGEAHTLPVAMQIDSALGQGRMKNVNKAKLRVYQSSGIFVGPDRDRLREVKQRTTEPYGVPPVLKTGEVEVTLPSGWGDGGQVFIRQTDPLPLTVLAMVLEIAMGG
jgi:hypothetical protein